MNNIVRTIIIRKTDDDELEMIITLSDGTFQSYYSKTVPDLINGDTLTVQFADETQYVDTGDLCEIEDI